MASSAPTRRPTKSKRVRPPRPAWWVWTKRILYIALSCAFFGCAAFVVLFSGEVSKAKDEVEKFRDMRDQYQIQPSKILSSDGKLLYQVMSERREYISLQDIPKLVQDAMVAAEDKRFREHRGIDYQAIPRILLVGAREGKLTQGGSTITMQLAKLMSGDSDRNIQRKLHDMALATAMERDLTKNEILELYLNTVYFGNQAYGIKAASDIYFGKPVSQITLGEAAFLVRLVRKPSSWSKLLSSGKNLDRAIANRNTVLGIMLEEGMISQPEYEKALEEDPKFNRKPHKGVARVYAAHYFVDHVLDVLKREPEFKDIDLGRGGYTIETTLDTRIQDTAEEQVRRVVRNHSDELVTTGAFLLMSADGQILAEVGGVDFNRNQYNVIYRGHRQPGSSFKPIVYATAFLNRALTSVDEPISNERLTLPAVPGREAYSPKNSNGTYGGELTVTEAFRNSWNVPAVRVIEKVGPQQVVTTARDAFGFVSPLGAYPSLALGTSRVNPREMAQAYSVFMLKGDRATPYEIKRITFPNGDSVEVKPRVTRYVLDPGVCETMDSLLRQVVENGTGKEAQIVPNARGKTGTTQLNTDAWFCGYSDGLVGIGWVANEVLRNGKSPAYRPMAKSVFGGTVTVEFWAAIMKEAHSLYGTKFLSKIEVKQPEPEEKPVKPKPAREHIPDVPTDAPSEPDSPITSEAPKLKEAPAEPDNTDSRPDDSAPTEPAPKDTVPQEQEKPAKKQKVENPPPTQEDSPKAETFEMVSVNICGDSGKRATDYCPVTITKKFKKGREPKGLCPLHRG